MSSAYLVGYAIGSLIGLYFVYGLVVRPIIAHMRGWWASRD